LGLATVILGFGCLGRDGFDSSAISASPGEVTVTGILPARGPDTGGLSVIVRGSGFASEHTVTLGGADCAVVSVSTTELRCATSAHASGRVDVVVGRNGAGAAARLDAGFDYLPTDFSSCSLVSGEYDPRGYVDGSASDARFGGSGDVAVIGNSLFVIDASNSAIREIDLTSGVVSTFYSELGWTGGIVTDGTDLYISESGAIWRIEPPNRTLVAGTEGQSGAADGPPNSGQLNSPAGMAHLAGVLYVADALNDAVRAVDLANGNLSTVATGIDKPYDVDTDGVDLIVGAYNGSSVYTVTTSGDVTLLAGGEGYGGSQDGTGSEARFGNVTGVVALDPTTRVVVDHSNHTLRRVTSAGVTTTWCGAADEAGAVNGPCSYARFFWPFRLVARAGELFVSDSAGAVRRIDASGQVSVLAGTLAAPGCVDGSTEQARFGELIDGVADGDFLYVTDRWCASVRRVSLADGSVTTVVGGPGRRRADGLAEAAGFDGPHGIALLNGVLYVTEDNGVTLRRFEPSTGVLDTVAGDANNPGGADGVGTAATFDTPCGIDTYGEHLVVVERSPGRLRLVEPDTGTVSTVTAALSGGPHGVTVVGTHAFSFSGGVIERVDLATGAVEPFSGRGCCGFEDGDTSIASYSELWHGESDGLKLVIADLYNDSVRRVSVADGSVTSWLAGPASVQEDDSVAAIRQPRSVVLTVRGTYVLNRYGVRLLAD
jgi:hypothetical protein